MGVRYTTENPPTRVAYARMVAQMLRPLGLHLLLEPGRTIIGPAGVLLTRVVYVKESRGKTFVVVDAAMNDLMRPALYGAVHPITRVTRDKDDDTPRQRVDIVGPVCETGDCFLRDWPLGRVETRRRFGDLGGWGLWDEPVVELQCAVSCCGGLCRRKQVSVDSEAGNPSDLLRGQVLR